MPIIRHTFRQRATLVTGRSEWRPAAARGWLPGTERPVIAVEAGSADSTPRKWVFAMSAPMWRMLVSGVLWGLIVAAIPIGAAGQQPAAKSAKSGGAGDPTSALSQGKPRYGIFGFGSLISDPGEELTRATGSRQDLETPFAVEYGRSSNTRGGAPTLVPVKTGGAKVKATVFVLKDSISEPEAESILYRRELHQVGSGRTYNPSPKPGKNSIVVAAWPSLIGLEKIFYTDFGDSGKLTNPTPALLAGLAVDSARNRAVPEGNDGISYLMNAKKAGIVTPLSADYEKEILRLTGTASLEQALAYARGTSAH
jgi:hypothetical protein